VVLIDSGCRGVKIAGLWPKLWFGRMTGYDVRKSPSLSVNGTRLTRYGGVGRSEDGRGQR
jgi:hypothetical protein